MSYICNVEIHTKMYGTLQIPDGKSLATEYAMLTTAL